MVRTTSLTRSTTGVERLSQKPSRPKHRVTAGGPDATASGFRRNKRSFLRAFDELVSSYRREIDAVDLLSLRDPDV
jgi:hypothetical protein